jgi:hypothetical protein
VRHRIHRTNITRPIADWAWRHQTKLILAGTVTLVALVFVFVLAGVAGAQASDPTKFGKRIHDTTMDNLKPLWLTVFPILSLVLACTKARREPAAWLTLCMAAFASFVVIWAGNDMVDVLTGVKDAVLGAGKGGG